MMPHVVLPNRIPVSMPDLSGNEQVYAAEAVGSSWISSSGEFLDRFEEEFADACGTKQAVTTSNGTTALHLVLAALGVGPGDEVIVPSMTYIATANAVTYCGGTPVFVDIDPDTWCLDPRAIEAAITPATKGIIPVHLLGHPADMDAINAVAKTHGLWVVEDAAEATFSRYKGRPIGSLATAATFSFFGNKIISCGEGGAVTCDDPELAARMRLLRGQGMDPNRRYHFPIVGFNFRLTNVAAAILCGQMERREAIVGRRREIVELYARELSGVPGISVRQDAPWADTAPWMASCLVDAGRFGCHRDELATALTARGVETRPLFIPIHKLPPYVDAAERRGTDLPVTDGLANLGLMLPTYPKLSDDDVVFICESIRDIGAERMRSRRAVARARIAVEGTNRSAARAA
jgi:perosamine synthetase